MKNKLKFIPVNVPKLYKQEKTNVIKCIKTNWISSEGKFVKDFEANFAKFNQRKYGIAVSSGTAALEIAVKSLNLKKLRSYHSSFFNNFHSVMCNQTRS